jgi:hypothetical protein
MYTQKLEEFGGIKTHMYQMFKYNIWIWVWISLSALIRVWGMDFILYGAPNRHRTLLV